MAATSYHDSVMRACVAAVKAEGLASVGDRVHQRKLPDRADLKFPCVLVTLEGVKEVVAPIDTEQDERRLPVQVHLLDRSDQRYTPDLPDWLAWREGVTDAFLMQLLPSVPTCWHVDTRPLETLEAQAALGPEYQLSRGGWVLEAWVITPRRRRSA